MKKFYNRNIRGIFLSLLLSIIFLSSCIKKVKNPHSSTNTTLTESSINHVEKTQKEQHTITIWVHGTRFITHNILSNFFYRKIGLHNVNSYKTSSNLLKVAKIMCRQNTPRFNIDNFYIFGWSGKLNFAERESTSNKLYKQIITLIENYKNKFGVIPKIRIITHSHGGNIALLLEEINKKLEGNLYIFELILLACPVQQRTSHLIKSKMFEKVYALYSAIDMIQVMDPQGIHRTSKSKRKSPLFSNRRFQQQENLIQSQIKIDRRGLLHIDFIRQKFAKLLPHILQELDAWSKEDNNNLSYNQKRLLKVSTKNNLARFERKIMKRKSSLPSFG